MVFQTIYLALRFCFSQSRLYLFPDLACDHTGNKSANDLACRLSGLAAALSYLVAFS
jgi:hypothetical protein